MTDRQRRERLNVAGSRNADADPRGTASGRILDPAVKVVAQDGGVLGRVVYIRVSGFAAGPQLGIFVSKFLVLQGGGHQREEQRCRAVAAFLQHIIPRGIARVAHFGGREFAVCAVKNDHMGRTGTAGIFGGDKVVCLCPYGTQRFGLPRPLVGMIQRHIGEDRAQRGGV